MSNWLEIKHRAREWHKILLTESMGNASAASLLSAAQKITRVQRVPCLPGDSLLCGAEAVFDPEAKSIWFDQSVDSEMSSFYQMHEYAHFNLHSGSWQCKRDVFDPEAFEEDAPMGISRVEGYNPKEQMEREANIFAREVLLPSDALRHLFLSEGKGASKIATQLGLPEGMVFHQLSFSLLVGDLITDKQEDEKPLESKPLDESQRAVAEWSSGALLVRAGPGTGKTRSLVGRVEYLLGRGASPSSILLLTFSNKAATEMRERINVAFPETALHIWMGTFHAFGLELLRKYGFKVSISQDFKVLDPVGSVALLESKLEILKLDYYRNLYEPTMYLYDILKAISRAKDELVGPAEYMQYAQKMLEDARTEEERVAAEKAAEVARVYAVYKEKLEREAFLDFGDLIFRSVKLLRQHSDIRRELQHKYPYILVDEYQDVNRASGILLKELAGDGNGLWVVGDTRQSIYRFRGASPANVRLFPVDFPGAETKSLGINYRSLPAIVNAISALAPRMKATQGQTFERWHIHRDAWPGEALLATAPDLDSEINGIAEKIKRLSRKGVPLRKQAILCRSHTTMVRVYERLGQNGVPVLYLGDLFERDEIRDLLSMLSLACEGHGRGLIRIAGFSEYKIPVADVLVLLKEAREQSVPFPKALDLGAGLEKISNDGKKGLALLRSHLEGIHFQKSPWGTLVQYLFNSSGYLANLLNDGSLVAHQKRLAIYQFLQFAHQWQDRTLRGERNQNKAFLNYVRSLELHGEEKVLRQVPDWASELDAVRLLTVHASKGLEFDAVFVPCVGQGIFPARRRGDPCPPPVGMISSKIVSGDHDEEEECLFFVALSRAQDFLCVSRSLRYNERNSNPPAILKIIEPQLLPFQWKAKKVEPKAPKRFAIKTLSEGVFEAKDLEKYIKCPLQYLYEAVFMFGGRREENGYMQFHHCVYEVLRWIREERTIGNPFDQKSAASRLEEIWAKLGPKDHAYAGIYGENAKAMVSLAVQLSAQSGRSLPIPKWELDLPLGKVSISPDAFEETSSGLLQAVRFRTGRRSKTESEKDIYALFQMAVEKEYRGKVRFRIHYLSSGDSQDINLSTKKLDSRVKKFNDAISGIMKGHFSPKPNDRDCPRCSHYFICPAPKIA